MPGPKSFSAEERKRVFWSKVHIKESDECWNWKAGKNQGGYGIFWAEDRYSAAHRFAWEVSNNTKIPWGKLVLHKCDNPPCCNPKHLFLGTHLDNVRDMIRKDRQNPFAMTKLTAQQIQDIRRLLKSKFTLKRIAGFFKVNKSTIFRIRHTKRYPCKEGYFVYF